MTSEQDGPYGPEYPIIKGTGSTGPTGPIGSNQMYESSYERSYQSSSNGFSLDRSSVNIYGNTVDDFRFVSRQKI